jgi:hypothetical protein
MTEPTRRLAPKNGQKAHRYTPASHTDIRRTFRAARLLARLQSKETTK